MRAVTPRVNERRSSRGKHEIDPRKEQLGDERLVGHAAIATHPTRSRRTGSTAAAPHSANNGYGTSPEGMRAMIPNSTVNTPTCTAGWMSAHDIPRSGLLVSRPDIPPREAVKGSAILADISDPLGPLSRAIDNDGRKPRGDGGPSGDISLRHRPRRGRTSGLMSRGHHPAGSAQTVTGSDVLKRARFAFARALAHALRVSTTMRAMSAHSLVVHIRVIGDDQNDVRLAHSLIGQLDRSPDRA